VGRFADQIDKDLVIQEALYGFIMALTFVTATQLGVYTMDRVTLITAIAAMDFVWGAIDLVIFFDIDIIAYRRRSHELAAACRSPSEESDRIISGLLEGTVFDDMDDETRKKAVELIRSGRCECMRDARSERRRYLFNAVTAFLVTISTVIPSALCLIFIDNLWLACLMASSTSCLALLFIGYKMAVSDRKIIRLLFGASMAGLTMVLTLFAAVFGG